MTETVIQDFFLDTTAQFNRHSLDRHSKDEIEGLLKSARITGSSTYARLEFKMSFLQDLAYLHGKLRQFRSIPEILSHLAKLQPFQARKLSRALNHMARFWQNIPRDDAVRIEIMIYSIEQAVFSIWRWFDSSVDSLSDGTGCVRSTEPPRLRGENLEVILRNCRPNRIRCRIHKFFEENRKLFDDIVNKINSIPEDERSNELKAIQHFTAQASANSTVLCDNRVCRKIGDALIGTDGKQFPAIISSNSKEFKLICEAVGNRLIPIRSS